MFCAALQRASTQVNLYSGISDKQTLQDSKISLLYGGVLYTESTKAMCIFNELARHVIRDCGSNLYVGMSVVEMF